MPAANRRAHAVPALVAGVGLGLIGSGVFVTDHVGGFPAEPSDEERLQDADAVGTASTREGRLHNLCAIPIFAGIPVAALAGAASALRGRDYRWAGDSLGSSVAMVGSFVLFGRALGGAPRLDGKGGVFQRLSIAIGFGWIAALLRRASGPRCRDGQPTGAGSRAASLKLFPPSSTCRDHPVRRAMYPLDAGCHASLAGSSRR